MAQGRNRKYSGIFPANVTFGDNVIVSQTKKGIVYAKAKAQVEMKDGTIVPRTVMAFGEQLMAIQPDFAAGHTVRLAVQYDNGTMKVIGYPLPPKESKAAAA